LKPDDSIFFAPNQSLTLLENYSVHRRADPSSSVRRRRRAAATADANPADTFILANKIPE